MVDSTLVSSWKVRVLEVWIQYRYAVMLYLFATLFTNASFMADTPDFARAIAAFKEGRYYFFWEFGHILWRPLGLVASIPLAPITRLIVGSSLGANATLTLIILNWVFGLIAVLAMAATLKRRVSTQRTMIIAITFFIFSACFLNYFHSGAAYIPGLSLIVVALYLLTVVEEQHTRSRRFAILAGLAMAAAICLWFPYVVVCPALIAYPLIFGARDKQHLLVAITAAGVCGLVVITIYIGVMVHIGIHNNADFRSWMEITSRSSTTSPVNGLKRMIFGFARAFIGMGSDGLLFKRYLFHDPFNPVSLLDLFRFSLSKLIGFYCFILAILTGLFGRDARLKTLVLLCIAAAPALGFAIYWHGGDAERYLALLPFIVLALAVGWTRERHRVFKAITLGFTVLMIVTNLIAFSSYNVDRQRQQSTSRLQPVLPLLKPNSILFTANWQDDLINFNRSFPFDPINRQANLRISAIASPGEPEVAFWRAEFSLIVQRTWWNGGEVWISTRVLSPTPKAEWNWAEGDDPRISWRDLFNYFSSMDFGETVGSADGFVRLLNTEKNKALLLIDSDNRQSDSDHR